MALIKCSECGHKISDQAKTCPKCGKRVTNVMSFQTNATIISTGKPKNKWISLLLCIFTVFGHKFYEGKTGMGILYIFTVGLFGIGWIIDIIKILSKPNPYYV